ncbi:MAG TPA: hypothetical protein VGQ83_40530 [Polyangia bacterium]|jgi:hypothetical protein
MRPALARAALLLLPLALLSCDPDHGAEVSCTWFADDNCWRQSLDAAQACAADPGTTGTLSADGSQCTFPDGTLIVFENPVDLANMEGWELHLTITRSGADCLQLDERQAGGVTLTTSLGTFREEVSNTEVDLTCPDLTKVHIEALALLGCGFENLPGVLTGWSATSLTVGLAGTGAQQGLTLFTCAQP